MTKDQGQMTKEDRMTKSEWSFLVGRALGVESWMATCRPVGILTGLDADRQAAKGAEGQEPVGSMREVGARNSSLYSFVMVIRVVGNGI